MKDKIISKLFSGRYFLTIIVGAVFAYLSILGKLPEDKIMMIVTMVFVLYFTKERNENEENTNSK